MARLGSRFSLLCLGIAILALPATLNAASGEQSEERDFLDGLEYRNIGPWRGGRVTAVAGSAKEPYTFYMGSTGGVWKTTNAGTTWVAVSDDDFNTAAVGALDVAPSNPAIVVAGMGESPFRGVASSQGDGLYKSVNGGTSWTHIGLENTRQISAVRIHPNNPDIIWVAAQGDSWGPSDERGIYKTNDGGKNWRKTLAGANRTTGAVDLKYDPKNPRTVYAALWDHQRKPWEVRSGGAGSGIYKSEDAGESWTQLTEGLPETMGKIGIAPSPARAGRIWAVVEAADDTGGVYRSDDRGETWVQVNKTRRVQARSWYYMHIFAHPTNPDTVYVLNAPFMKSIDGGETFTEIKGPHGDHHDLWVNPDHPNIMVNGNDGGGTVTLDGGNSWSTQHNQPTAQFYRVITDDQTPYRLYAGQQDNSTVSIPSRAPDGRIGRDDYYAIGGGESAHVAFDPNNPRYIYAGSYLGFLTEYDSETQTVRTINPYPELRFGVSPSERRYRWNWNAPVLVSQHDPKVIFHGGNHVLMSQDRGTSWTEYSPDLTRNDKATQGPGGGPITNEVSENYSTILYLADSAAEKGVLWVGTDDGRLQLTRDDGANWRDVTPRRVKDGMFNAIEVSPHDPAVAYVAYTRYKYSDQKPYIYRTQNYGASWRRIDNGLPDNAFVRVVREDTKRKGLLYAGTERGLFFSTDNGGSWQSLRLNLPVVPITDLRVHNHDLVVATQGRAFWILDDLSPLRELNGEIETVKAHLFSPKTAQVFERGGGNGGEGPNPLAGATLYYSLATELDLEDSTLSLEVLDSDGASLRSLTTDKETGVEGGGEGVLYHLPAQKGINRISWDTRHDPITQIPGVWAVNGGDAQIVPGYRLGPGTYRVRLSIDDAVIGEASLSIEKDPRIELDPEKTAEQQAMVRKLYAMIDELHGSVNALRSIKAQIETRNQAATAKSDSTDLKQAGEAVIEAVDAWEKSVITKEREFFQDVLNWPDRLDADLQVLYGAVDAATQGLSKGLRERFEDLQENWMDAIARRDALVNGPIAEYNQQFKATEQPGVALPAYRGDIE